MSNASPAPNHPAVPDDAPPFRYTAALAAQFESTWQARWAAEKTFAAPNPGEPGFDASRPKKYILDMFPYPSGVGLHVGHPLGYIATDIFARYLRMTGHNVLHAMGYDSFGLPAEQYAVQTNTHPRVTTEANIATMRRQLARLGLAHDARRSVSTTDAAFYKWTQWIFLTIFNSWYDPDAPARGGQGRGRARPIAELIEQFERGDRPNKSGKPWSQLSEKVKREHVDEHRLAYLAEVPVNWCPMLGTVLANEEVTSDDRSERGNFPVYKRPLKQWMMRITEYADRLLADLDPLDWSESVKLLQRNWIGRSEGAYVDFDCGTRRIRVFTTRPDTLYGATYMVLSPEHAMVEHLVTDKFGETKFVKAVFPGADELLAADAGPREMVAAYRAYAASKTEDERTGGADKTGCFIGAYAVNPVSGTRVPVFIADYVLASYGTGAIMAVPAHDVRDWAFAELFALPKIRVVAPAGGPASGGEPTECFIDEGVAVNSPLIDRLPTAVAKQKITAFLDSQGRGKHHVNYKLRDWLFSRQRYWGEPFPIVFDEQGLPHALPESALPLLLPEMDNFQPEASEDPDAPPRPPLGRAKGWDQVTLDLNDGRGPRAFTRELNTMPNWAGSCWYYLRYLDPDNEQALVDSAVDRYWMAGSTTSEPVASAGARSLAGGVDLYVGGVEHAVLHLLYARFWHKVLFDLGHVSTLEPFHRLFNQGYIQAAAYTDARGSYVPASEVEHREHEVSVDIDTFTLSSGAKEPLRKATKCFWKDQPVFQQFGKMGKSLKNAVSPDEVCAEFGCDTLRVYEMSMGPLEASKPWNTRDITGAYRFLQRVWRNIIDEQSGRPRVGDDAVPADVLRLMHKTIAGVRKDMETLGFNTAVAKLIEFNNELTKQLGPDARRDGHPVTLPRPVAQTLTLLLAPLAPHIAEALWERLGHAGTLAFAPFPVADPALAADDQVEIVVQVLGKIRARLLMPAASDAKAIEAAALADETVQQHLGGKPIKKLIVVPGKLVNIVI